jgi:hypothetical protein
MACVGITACGGATEPLGSESIVDQETGSGQEVDRGGAHKREDDRGSVDKTMLANSSFERRTLTPWQITGEEYASFTITRGPSREGQRSVRIRAQGTRVAGSVVLGQLVPGAAGITSGSRLRLEVRALTRGLNRRVQVSIKLRYDNGDFDFFQGRAVTGPPDFARLGTGIPPGTRQRWITVRADGVAKRRIGVMGVYAFDSGPGPLRGAVWIDSVELSSAETNGG